ncbi:MAG: chemotaxis-specific protein-glutamate methyltransferase CheB, partial [Planctomycetota bacterium]|nr:chemotaxis-specific protein-glutamate methyltransferase CheB [Planctomycetota bacterium]
TDTARNGADAIEKIKRLRPDIITMDIEMPGMDGLTALRQIMRECPTPTLMCSSLTKAGSHQALQAMRLGAADVIVKPGGAGTGDVNAMRDELVGKIKAIGGRRGMAEAKRAPSIAARTRIPSLRRDAFELALIGSSTGGPPALEQVLVRLPADMAVPVVVAQHMPALFTRSMSERLDASSALTVVHGENGMPLFPGAVYIAEGGKHTHIVRESGGLLHLRVDDEPGSESRRPSVNVLFSTGAAAGGGRTLGVVLTGMGEDGLRGAREIHARGGMVLAQNEATSVVYGMPKAIAAAGLAAASLSPEEIGRALAQLSPTAAPATLPLEQAG